MGAFLKTNNSSLARWWRRRASQHVSAATAVVLGGCQGSGASLLRVMLDSHPHIAAGPETSLLTGSYIPHKLAGRFDIATQELWQLRRQATDHAHFVELFFERYAASRGKLRWAEKTPQNICHLAWIFQHFPRARFIHVVRDGRDVVCSLRTHPRYRAANGESVPTRVRRPLKPCIHAWLHDTAIGLKWRGHAEYLEVRYEDLVETPEAALRGVCAFIGETYDPSLLQFHEDRGPSRDAARSVITAAATRPLSHRALGRWETELTGPELALFDKLAGHRLTDLGYDRAHAGPARERDDATAPLPANSR